MAMRTPSALEPVERTDRVLHVVHQRALGHLEAQPGRIEPGQVEHVGHHLDQLGIGQLAGRQVDRHLDLAPAGQRRPAHGLRDAASLSTHHPIGTIRPVSSAIGMKLLGITTSWPGRFQRTSASTWVMVPSLSCDHRLVVQLELPALDGRPQRPLVGQTLDGALVEVGLEDHPLVASLVLGPVHGHVGVTDERLGRDRSDRW